MKFKLIVAIILFAFIHFKVNAQVIDTVRDIATLQAYAGNAGVVYVKDSLRGGLFSRTSSGMANGGTVFAGSGGAFWNRSGVNGVYNVKWWGAKGDSVTDDRASIQQAMNYLGQRNGGTLYFPEGIYVLSNSNAVTVGNNVTIYGHNRYKTKLYKIAKTRADAFFLVNGNNFHLTGLGFSADSATAARGLIEVVQGNHIKIDNCMFNGGFQGVQLNPGQSQTISNVELSGNYFNRIIAAITIGTTDTITNDSIVNVTIINNLIENGRIKSCEIGLGGDGIKTLRKCHNINIIGNSISGNSRDGIDLFASGDRINVQNNFIFNNDIKGVDIKSDVPNYPFDKYGYNGRLITINNNHFEHNLAGIGISRNVNTGDYNYGIEIANNTFSYHQQNSINITGRHFLISNNQFLYNSTSDAASFHVINMGDNALTKSVQDALVSGNLFVNNGNTKTNPYAIYVGLYGANISIEQNKMTNDTTVKVSIEQYQKTKDPFRKDTCLRPYDTIMDIAYQKSGIYINDITTAVRLRGNTMNNLQTPYTVNINAGVDFEPVFIYDTTSIASTAITNAYLNLSYPVSRYLVKTNVIFTNLTGQPNAWLQCTRMSNTTWHIGSVTP